MKYFFLMLFIVTNAGFAKKAAEDTKNAPVLPGQTRSDREFRHLLQYTRARETPENTQNRGIQNAYIQNAAIPLGAVPSPVRHKKYSGLKEINGLFSTDNRNTFVSQGQTRSGRKFHTSLQNAPRDEPIQNVASQVEHVRELQGPIHRNHPINLDDVSLESQHPEDKDIFEPKALESEPLVSEHSQARNTFESMISDIPTGTKSNPSFHHPLHAYTKSPHSHPIKTLILNETQNAMDREVPMTMVSEPKIPEPKILSPIPPRPNLDMDRNRYMFSDMNENAHKNNERDRFFNPVTNAYFSNLHLGQGNFGHGAPFGQRNFSYGALGGDSFHNRLPNIGYNTGYPNPNATNFNPPKIYHDVEYYLRNDDENDEKTSNLDD